MIIDEMFKKYTDGFNDGIDSVKEKIENEIEELKEIASEDALNNMMKIVSSCNVQIEYESGLLPIYDETIDRKEYLKKIANKGLAKRLNNEIPKKYQERLDYELEVINEMNFNDYFLIVYDYVLYAKKHNILVGPGRGSAAGSLVSYTLGITDIDPIKYGLLFERFLNKERVTMPDIDIDFDGTKRQEVIEYVINKYGKYKVAGIITFNKLGAKQVIRDVGKILKINDHQVDVLAKMVKKDKTLFETYNEVDSFKKLINSNETLKRLYDISLHLEGLPRHISVHAAGIVMSQINLDKTVPLYKNPNGMYVTQYDKNYLESLGLLKMDFLSLSNLTMIDEIIKAISEEEKINITFQNIPLDDPETMKLFKQGLTDDIFQFESAGMKSLLKKLNPKNFLDIVIALALYRPGPMDEIDSFLKKRNNLVEIDYYSDALIPILKDTSGTVVYQEQIMEIAKTIAGFSLGEADILRSAMSKKKEDVFNVIKPIVVFGDHTRVLKYVDFDFVLGADGVKILQPIDALNAKFLFYYLKWSNIPSLGYSRHYKLLKEISVPVPPLPIQQRIIAELDCISTILEKKRQQLKELDNLAQAIFYDMFGDPDEIFIKWNYLTLEEVCLKLQFFLDSFVRQEIHCHAKLCS